MTYSTQQDESMNYALLFGGIASLVFGALLLFQREFSLGVVMLLIGLLWFIQGVAAIMSIFLDKSGWGWKLFFGAIGVAAGLLVFRNPIDSATVLPAIFAFLMGIFGVIMGIGGLIDAFKGSGWGVGVFSVVAIIIGLLFIFNSAVSGQVLVWILAVLLVIQGAAAVYYAYKYR